MTYVRTAQLLLFFLSAACGKEPAAPLPTVPPDLTTTTGSRLRAQIVEAVDGNARRFLQVVDREMQQPCRFGGATAEDRITCFPRAYGTVVFLDEACTKPYFASSQGEHALAFAEGVPPLVGTLRVGARFMSPTTDARYMGDGAGHCFASGVDKDVPLYEVLEFVKDEELAQGKLERVAASDDLDAIVFNGDDKSSFIYDLIDRTSGVPCTPAMTEAGPRCKAQIGEAHDDGLLDTSCERLVIVEYNLDAVAIVPERQNQVYRFTRAENRDEQVGRLDSRGQCQIESIQLGRRTMYFGDPYPAEKWPALRLEAAGGDRLSTRVAVLPNGVSGEAERRVDPAAMFEDRGTPCGPVWRAGSLRCFPATPPEVLWWARLFADARCSTPAMAMRGTGSPPETVTLRDDLTNADQGFLPTGRVLETLHEIRRGEAYELNYMTGTCSVSRLDARFFVLGQELQATSFPELRLVTE